MTKQLSAKIGIFVASLALILSIFALLLLNGSTAWFSYNDEVLAKNLALSAKVSPNLIIGKTPEDLVAENFLFEVDFSGAHRYDMIAVTHDSDATDTYLKYLTNNYAVDNKTGLEKPGETLEFAPVPSFDNERYFIDYTVYIASTSADLDVKALNAAIVFDGDIDVEREYVKAASIDFYVDDVSSEGYRGTVSVSKTLDDAPDKSVDLFASAGGTVPLNTEGHIKVIMRCYFDGALKSADSGNAYINSFTVKPDGISFGVSIVAVDKD